MKVFMPKPNEDWVCDHIIDEFRHSTRHQPVNDICEADVVWLYAKWIWNHFVGQLTRKKVITTVHHIVPEKTGPREFIDLYDKFTDVYHVPNKHTARELVMRTAKPIKRLPYWINDDRWGTIDKETLDGGIQRIKDTHWEPMLSGRRILASFQRDTEGSSIGPNLIPAAKFEKGPDRYVKIIERFKRDEVVPFFPGWRRDFIKLMLEEDYDIVTGDKMQAGMLNGVYNLIGHFDGYYLVTSRHEGGPQAVLEAAQTRVKILSSDVGIASEVLHPDCICRSTDEFEKKIREDAIEHTVDYNFESVQAFKRDIIVPQYDDLIDEVAG